MSEWNVRQVALREIASEIKDGSHGTHLRVDEGVPFLSAKNVSQRGKLIVENTEEKVSEAEYKIITSGFKPRANDLLITVVGTVGRRALYNGVRAAFQRSVAFVRPNNEVLPEYLYHAAGDTAFIAQLHRRSNITAQAGLYLGELAKIRIPLPDLVAQRRIASILTTMDEEIEATEALIAKHQQIKAGLMHDLFTRGLWTQAELDRNDHKGTPCEATAKPGHLRPTPEQAPHLYQDSPLGKIPKAWKLSSIGEVAESLADGPFGSNLKTEHYVIEPGVRVVRLQNIQTTRYNDDDRVFVSDSHANYLLRNQVNPGDILIAGLGEDRHVVARACCYPDDLPSAINKADCFRLRCKSEQALNPFVMFYLNTSTAREQVRRYEQGVTRLRINGGNLKRLLIGLPKLDEQASAVERLYAGGNEADIETAHLAKLRQQKQGLMHDLLTGRVRVDKPEGEK